MSYLRISENILILMTFFSIGIIHCISFKKKKKGGQRQMKPPFLSSENDVNVEYFFPSMNSRFIQYFFFFLLIWHAKTCISILNRSNAVHWLPGALNYVTWRNSSSGHFFFFFCVGGWEESVSRSIVHSKSHALSAVHFKRRGDLFTRRRGTSVQKKGRPLCENHRSEKSIKFSDNRTNKIYHAVPIICTFLFTPERQEPLAFVPQNIHSSSFAFKPLSPFLPQCPAYTKTFLPLCFILLRTSRLTEVWAEIGTSQRSLVDISRSLCNAG